MDFQSVSQYEGKRVKITLINNFWYRAKILSVSENVVEFIEEKGKHISVTPEAVLMIMELGEHQQ